MPSRLYTTQAKLYDIAFSWDTSEEVEWLLERLGSDCAPILEPACGSGRMLAAFAERGVEAIGIDTSPSMVALARERWLCDVGRCGRTVGQCPAYEAAKSRHVGP